MKWEILTSYDELSDRAAAILLTFIRQNPAAVLGLPTGRTPEGMYGRVVASCSREYHCFQNVRTFNLDEYVGIPREHPASYYSYMAGHLFDKVDIDHRNVHLPDGSIGSMIEGEASMRLEESCRQYEASLVRVGGLDLTFLGLGGNGHIGFNEPGDAFDSRTHVVELADSTRKANARYFPDGIVPERAITMGIGTILESRRIVLLASGSAKREAVRRLRSGQVDNSFPASSLHGHSDVTVLLDGEAAD